MIGVVEDGVIARFVQNRTLVPAVQPDDCIGWESCPSPRGIGATVLRRSRPLISLRARPLPDRGEGAARYCSRPTTGVTLQPCQPGESVKRRLPKVASERALEFRGTGRMRTEVDPDRETAEPLLKVYPCRSRCRLRSQ